MSLQVYAAPFQWRLLIFIRKNFWIAGAEANKKQVSLKGYPLKIRIDSYRIDNINILTGITDQKIPCVYVHVYQIIKNRGRCPFNSLCHADNREYFSGLSLSWNRREVHMFYMVRKVRKIWRCSCWEKDNFIMIKEFKYGQTWQIWPFPHHFTVPLTYDLTGLKVTLMQIWKSPYMLVLI